MTRDTANRFLNAVRTYLIQSAREHNLPRIREYWELAHGIVMVYDYDNDYDLYYHNDWWQCGCWTERKPFASGRDNQSFAHVRAINGSRFGATPTSVIEGAKKVIFKRRERDQLPWHPEARRISF